jgi:hypothetical protein
LNTTGWLAIYGALLSSFTAGWNAVRDLGDRAKVKIHATIGYVHQSEAGDYFLSAAFVAKNKLQIDQSPLLKVTFTNVGRRAITLTQWGAKLRKGEKTGFKVAIAKSLPVKIDEGAYTHETTDDLSILDDKTTRLFVLDSTGKYWYIPRSKLRTVRDQLNEFTNRTK